MAFSDAILLMEAAPFWSMMFFIMLILLGIDSEFGTLEASIAPFYDMGLVKMKKSYFTGKLPLRFQVLDTVHIR